METATIKPPMWYWIVSALALVWMMIGVFAWISDLMTDETALVQMSEAQRQLYLSRPQWLFVVYAIAIFSGLIGSIGLLIRKSWAKGALVISLAAIILQFSYTLLGMETIRLLGAATAILFPLVVFLIGILLIWFTVHSKKSGWFAA
jgi:hypothetical protein